jgi:hypothetical protein
VYFSSSKKLVNLDLTGEGVGVRLSGKFTDLTGFSVKKASLRLREKIKTPLILSQLVNGLLGSFEKYRNTKQCQFVVQYEVAQRKNFVYRQPLDTYM